MHCAPNFKILLTIIALNPLKYNDNLPMTALVKTRSPIKTDTKPAPATESAAAGASEESLYAAVVRALLAGRLRPGTALRERYLTQEFGVTRGLVRKVLLRLGQEGKLEIRVNSGAYVPKPTAEQVRQAYGARKAVEAGLLAVLAQDLSASQLRRLKAHLKSERATSLQAKREESVKLAGDFHLLLAELVGNPELSAIVSRLIARTQMFVALFEPAHASHCAPEEHAPVVIALEQGDTAAAVAAMLAHLGQVQDRVLASMQTSHPPEVADILRAALKEST